MAKFKVDANVIMDVGSFDSTEALKAQAEKVVGRFVSDLVVGTFPDPARCKLTMKLSLEQKD